MQRDEIKKKYLEIIKKLKDHNKSYYEKSKPSISDAEFDKLKKKNIRFRGKT